MSDATERDMIYQRYTELVDLLERAGCGPLLITAEFLRLSVNAAVSRCGRDSVAKVLEEHARRVAAEYA